MFMNEQDVKSDDYYIDAKGYPRFEEDNKENRWWKDKLVSRWVAYYNIYKPYEETYSEKWDDLVVHHHDENKLNFATENLRIMTKEEHEQLHNTRRIDGFMIDESEEVPKTASDEEAEHIIKSWDEEKGNEKLSAAEVKHIMDSWEEEVSIEPEPYYEPKKKKYAAERKRKKRESEILEGIVFFVREVKKKTENEKLCQTVKRKAHTKINDFVQMTDPQIEDVLNNIVKEEKRKKTKDIEKLPIMAFGLVLVWVLLWYFKAPQEYFDLLIEFFTIIFTGAVLSIAAGSLIEAAGGNFLKKISWRITVFGHKFSITAFFIAVIIVKFWLF